MVHRRLAFTITLALLVAARPSLTVDAQRPGLRLLQAAARAHDAAPAATYARDVAPIFQKACVACHRSSGMAPMSLETYREARPWAKSIREAVVERKMPPWHADPKHGEFRNDRRLSAAEIDTIVGWVDGGAPQGDPAAAAAPAFVDGWRIGKPDAVLQMTAEYTLGPQGPDEYQYFLVPTGFTEDRWIQAAEARPGNSRVVHHIIAFIQPKQRPQPTRGQGGGGSTSKPIFYKDQTLIRVREETPVHDNGCTMALGGAGTRMDGSERDMMPTLLCGEAPGRDADVWGDGLAKFLPAGADLLLQVHYSRNGATEKDRSSIGLVFARHPPGREVVTMPIQNHYFRIPPGAERHPASACYTFPEAVHLTSMMPHMHLRGKDMLFRAFYPDGRTEVLLSVPNYSFNWQTTYYLKKPVPLPAGTRIEVTAHFDNSAKNPVNPDPTKTVRWGDPTYDEMLIGWVDYYRDAAAISKGSSTASNAR